MNEVAKAQAEFARLWSGPGAGKSGPKAKLTAREIAQNAVKLADRDGIDALSMRSVAVALGISPMGLYTYFPSKSELIEVMVDEAYSDINLSFDDKIGWRERLVAVAENNWSLIMQHPWLAEVESHRPVLGPNVIAKYDLELGAVDGIGLSDIEMDLVLSTMLNFVRGTAKSKLDTLASSRRTGQSDEAWWCIRGPLLARALQDNYLLAQRVGAAAGAHHNAPSDADLSFHFGLERMLDGIACLLNDLGSGLPASA